MAGILNRGKCGGEKIKEVITGGMTDSVHWDGGYVVKSGTTYEKSDEYSTFTCEKCGATL